MPVDESEPKLKPISEKELGPIKTLTPEQVISLVDLLKEAKTKAEMPMISKLGPYFNAEADAERDMIAKNNIKKGEIKVLTEVLTLLGQEHLINTWV